MNDELERLEAELAARTASAQPSAPTVKPDGEAEQKRIEREERVLCAKLYRDLARRKMLDEKAMQQAATRRERAEWFDDNPHWRD